MRSACSCAARRTEPARGNQATQRRLESDGALPQQVRDRYEPRFGHDFSGVRIHTDGRAAETARAFGAEAFTTGTDIVFASGRYDPASRSGQELLSHELTHVVQQERTGARIQRKCGAGAAPDCTPVTVNATDPPRGTRFFFNVNCDDFEAGQQKALETFADGMPAGSDIEIIGMASSDGSADLNASLACRRARAAENVLRAKGLGGSIKLVQATGEVPGTDFNRNFRSAEVIFTKKPTPAADPVFSISGTPKASAEPDDREFISTLQAVQFMGDFKLQATVAVATVQASDADDWQAGVVQTVASPIHQTCFNFPPGNAPAGHPHANEIFVGNLPKTVPFLVPDRDGSHPIFMTNATFSDLKDAHKGRTAFVQVYKAEDHPQAGVLNSLFNITKDPQDSRALLIHQHKFGFFLTDVIARQKSTGRVIPLHRVEWVGFVDADYDPSTVPGFPPTAQVRNRAFRIISSHAFTDKDVPPAISGKAIRELDKQVGDWGKRCPRF